VSAEVILHNARIATNGVPSFVEAIAISDGKVTAIGGNEEILRQRGPATRVVDGRGRTVIPGLNDSHMHPIRGGLNYNLELRWDGVTSLADALRMLKEQAARTPAPQWVRVIGGWTEFQFAEGRMPTLDEINAAAPDTPVFVMHLYDRALLNGAALRALGYDKHAPDFPAGEVQRDRHGNPTGLLLAKPNANILYSTLAKGPKLSREDQLNSSRLFFRELNRFGITSQHRVMLTRRERRLNASNKSFGVAIAMLMSTGIAPLFPMWSTALAVADAATVTPNVTVEPQYDTAQVYVAPEDFDRFVASLVATFGGTTSKQGVFTVTPTPSSTMSQLVLTPVGTLSVFGFKTPVPYPFGAERTGYLVTDLDAAVQAARAAGADILVTPFNDPIGRDAIIQWPGGVNTQL
jgi:hypothetical protein